MKLIKPSVNAIPYDYYINQIANAAHLCYKQESSTTPNDKFVQSLINRQHLAMLEHGTIYLTIPYDDLDNTHEEIDALIKRYEKNPYSKVFAYSEHDDEKFNRTIFVTTNYRVIIENKWQDDLQFTSLPSVHEKRYSFHVVTDRATATQLLRQVLVRVSDDEEWEASYFSHIRNTSKFHYYVAGNLHWKQCIPYEGNENLVGTTNKPKEG